MPTALANPSATEKYESIAQQYDEKYSGPLWNLYDHVTMATAAPLFPPGAHILDAGAGTGKFALQWLRRSYRVTLLDPSSGMLDVARARIGTEFGPDRVTYEVGTIERMEFPASSFDAVFCEGDPLSYCLTTYAAAAKELIRVLRPGGRFYVSCDNRWYSAWARAANGQVDAAFQTATTGLSTDPYGVPVHAFDPDELAALFRDAGATKVRVAGKIVLSHAMKPAVLEQILGREEDRRNWYALETFLGQKSAMAGLSPHITVIGEKPQAGDP